MPSERHLIMESPEMHFSLDMQNYIAQEVTRPCKQWIHEVLGAQRETERVKLRTEEFVLLPDVDTIPHQVFSRLLLDQSSAHRWGQPPVPAHPDAAQRGLEIQPAKKAPRDTMVSKPQPTHCNGWMQPIEKRWRSRKPVNSLHWLAVATDTTLRTLRDLRGMHIPMLLAMYTQTCKKIHDDTGIPLDQIMAYVHYPPSVYQLHIHFKHPVGPHFSHDSFRIHPLVTIINNLKIDPDYYAKSVLQLPVYSHTELYTALGLPGGVAPKQQQIQTQVSTISPDEPGTIETKSSES